MSISAGYWDKEGGTPFQVACCCLLEEISVGRSQSARPTLDLPFSRLRASLNPLHPTKGGAVRLKRIV